MVGTQWRADQLPGQAWLQPSPDCPSLPQAERDYEVVTGIGNKQRDLHVMNEEESIAMLEQHIESLELARVDPNEREQVFLDMTLTEARRLLERIQAGDKAAVQEIRILDQAQ
jgi:hypothetical protein